LATGLTITQRSPLPRVTTAADSTPAAAGGHEFADVRNGSKGRSIHIRFHLISDNNTVIMLRDAVFMYVRL
jgi:hypothetical protein